MELIKMPRLGITMKSGTIGTWLKTSGEYVQQGEEIFELETEKSVIGVEAQGSGILHVVVEAGVEVPINTIVGVLAQVGEEVDLSHFGVVPTDSKSPETHVTQWSEGEPNPSNSTSARSGSMKALPRVRKLALELGVNLQTVIGTGAGGEITEHDVRLAASMNTFEEDVDKVERLAGVRKAMAENMAKSWSTVPQFTQIIEIDVTQIKNYRERVKQAGSSVGYTAIIVKVVADVLACSPAINARFEDGNLVHLRNAHIGVATATVHGLVVPVIRKVQAMELTEVRDALKATIERARVGFLRPEDYAGGSLTVSNLGMYGIDAGTPILNLGQSCLVFVGGLKEKVVVINGEMTIRPVMSMSFTYDHRIIDGVQGAEFTNQVRRALESFSVVC